MKVKLFSIVALTTAMISTTQAKSIVQDAEFEKYAAEHKVQWAKEDNNLNKRLTALVQNIWSVGGSSDPNQDVNSLLWQYCINYNFDNGWYATSTPIMTADSGDQWTLPVGGGHWKTNEV